MDFDEDVPSDNEQQEQFLVDNLDDDDAWNQRQRERSPTPVYDDHNKSKPRKRLIKKSSARESTPDLGIGYEEDAYGDAAADDMTGIVRDESDGGGPSSSSAAGGKRKRFGMEFSEEKRKEKKRREKGEKKFKLRKNGGYSAGGRLKDQEGDPEMKEMWDTIAGGDSEVCPMISVVVMFSIVLFQVSQETFFLFLFKNPDLNMTGSSLSGKAGVTNAVSLVSGS